MPGARPSGFQFTSPGRLRLFSTDELLKLPAPSWLIDTVLPAGGLISIYGPPGCGKSFLALDMALCVASARPWQGKAVQPGFVVYVSAEGTAGLGRRVLAWLTANQVDMALPDISWIAESAIIYAGSEDLDLLFARFEEVGMWPVLVIFDTLARCFEGDENLQEPMGQFVKGIDRLRHEAGSTILVVHHTGADGSRERGSTSFRGAADTMIRVVPGFLGQSKGKFLRPPQGTFTMVVDKMKDAECPPVALGTLDPVPTVNSCVISLEWLTKEGEQALASS